MRNTQVKSIRYAVLVVFLVAIFASGLFPASMSATRAQAQQDGAGSNPTENRADTEAPEPDLQTSKERKAYRESVEREYTAKIERQAKEARRTFIDELEADSRRLQEQRDSLLANSVSPEEFSESVVNPENPADSQNRVRSQQELPQKAELTELSEQQAKTAPREDEPADHGSEKNDPDENSEKESEREARLRLVEFQLSLLREDRQRVLASEAENNDTSLQSFSTSSDEGSVAFPDNGVASTGLDTTGSDTSSSSAPTTQSSEVITQCANQEIVANEYLALRVDRGNGNYSPSAAIGIDAKPAYGYNNPDYDGHRSGSSYALNLNARCGEPLVNNGQEVFVKVVNTATGASNYYSYGQTMAGYGTNGTPRKVGSTVVSTWTTPEGVAVEQTVLLTSRRSGEPSDIADIRYRVTNTSSAALTYSLQMNMPADVDGEGDAFFRVQDASSRTTVNSSRSYNGSLVPDSISPVWDADVNGVAERRSATAFLQSFRSATRPDVLSLGGSSNFLTPTFGVLYSADTGDAIGQLPVYAAVWKDRSLASGSVQTLYSYYGSPSDRDNVSPTDTPDSTNGEEQGVPEDRDASVGDPVSVTTGNMYDTYTDISIPGGSGSIPLSFERTYNSQDSDSSSMGTGWRHSYESSLDTTPTQYPDAPSGSVLLTRADGSEVLYERRSDGTYRTPVESGTNDTLTKTLTQGGTTIYVLEKPDGMKWTYTASGFLSRILDRDGRELLQFAYSNRGLGWIKDVHGRYTYFYYLLGNLDEVRDPSGKSVYYNYDNSGRLASVVDRSGAKTTYSYAQDGNISEIRRPADTTYDTPESVVSFTYDTEDRVTESSGVNGYQRVRFAYAPNADGSGTTRVTDARGNASVYAYDTERNIMSITDPYGNRLNSTWQDGQKTSQTDQNSNTTSYTYDRRGNVTSVTAPKSSTSEAAPTTTITYNEYSDPVRVVDATGGESTFEYNASGDPVRVTDAAGRTTTFEYDARARLIKSVDGRGNASADTADGTTTLAYDAGGVNSYGMPTEITDASGNTKTLTYDRMGRPLTSTDSLGRKTTLAYDNEGRMTRITEPPAASGATAGVSSVIYDRRGNPVRITDQNSNTTSLVYDANDLLLREADALANTTRYTYDAMGEPLTITDPLGNVTRNTYDRMSRLTRTVEPDGTTAGILHGYAYDAGGRLTSYTDPRSEITRYAYDGRDQLISTTDAQAPTPGVARFEYDKLGRMTKATNPNGNATSYTYNAVGDMLSEVDALGRSWLYTYDQNGNTASYKDALNRTTNYTYDPLDRLTQTTFPNSTKETFTYDAVGNMRSAANSNGTLSFDYDGLDRLVKETLTDGRTLGHEYDLAGRETALVDTAGGRTLYGYDAADRMTSVTDPVGAKTNYSYNARSDLLSATYPTGASDAYTYDPVGRMSRATSNGKTPAGAAAIHSQQTYSYDKSSNLTNILYPEGGQNTFSYDNVNRLVWEQQGRVLEYKYDLAGNREQTIEPIDDIRIHTSYTYNRAEQMTAAGNATYSNNANGNRTSTTSGSVSTSYAYDYEDAMTRHGQTTLRRDALGRIISETDPSNVATRYVYDGDAIVQERVGTDAEGFYTRGAGGIASRRASGVSSYYHYDLLSNVRLLSKADATVANSYLYTSFGGLRGATTEGVAQPFGNVSNIRMGSSASSGAVGTDLYDFKARMYEPSTGRFLQKDPVRGYAELTQTLAPYHYGVNNPYAYPDPNGDIAPLVVAAGLVAVGGGVGGTVGTTAYLLTEDDPSIRDAGAAFAGGAIIGGVTAVAAPLAAAATPLTATVGISSTAGTLGIIAIGGASGAIVEDGISAETSINPCSSVIGGASSLAGGAIGRGLFKTVGMDTFRQLPHFAPRSLKGFVPKALGGNAGKNANNVFYKPVPLDVAGSVMSNELSGYFLSTGKKCQ